MRSLRGVYCLIVVGIFSCKEGIMEPIGGSNGGGVVNGVYILNEGGFGDPEGARLSLYDIDRDTVYRDVFENANGGMHLGSLGDDIKISAEKVYILMSGSENLEVISLSDHETIQSSSFAGSNPHDLLIDAARNRAYITRLFASSVLIIDLGTLQPIDTVSVGANPQGMLLFNDHLFVCNSGYGLDRTVSVINVVSGVVDTTLAVRDGPGGVVLGPDGRIWVSCSGNAFGAPPTLGAVFLINPGSLAVEDSILFLENLWGSIAAGTDGSIYILGVSPGSFFGGPVHKIVSATHSVSLNFIPGTFYSLAVDSLSGEIYTADVKDFNGDGEVDIFKSDGTLQKTFTVQLGPGAFAFKR